MQPPVNRFWPAARLIISPLMLMLASSAWQSQPVLAQDRAPVQKRTPASGREKESGFAEAARVVAERLVAAFPRVEGLVIGFEGDHVLIDRGTADGVFQGMELEVFREGEEFKHPLTMEVLGRLDKELGMIRVMQVRERYAVAAISKRVEKAVIRQGDQVRVSMARMIAAFPNVEGDEVKGASTRSVTKDLAAALVRTGRFELIDERQLRSMLLADKNLTAGELTDPRILKQLLDKGKAQALLLGRLTLLANGASLDIQAYSTLTGSPLVLASAEVKPASALQVRPAPGAGRGNAGGPAELTTGRSTEPFGSAQDSLKEGGSAGSTMISPGRASKPRLSVAPPSERFRLGPEFGRPMRALAVGDLDGDGKPELVLAGADRLLIQRIEGRRLQPLAERALNGKEAVAVLDVADLTGDGRGEIVVSLSQKGHFNSLVLQLKDGALVPLWEAPDLVLRVLSLDGSTAQLFGQEATPGGKSGDREAGRTFAPIRHYSWNGRTYTPGQVLDSPGVIPLLRLSIADLGGDRGTGFLTMKEGPVLEVHSSTEGLIATYKDSGHLATSRFLSSPRILVERSRNGERLHIIVGREEETGIRMLRWLTRSRVASLTALGWDGVGFQELWQTPASEGSLADYAVVDLGGGLGRHLLLLVVKEGRLGFGGSSEIQAFRLR